MDAQEYGNIPQHRERIFIVAFKDVGKCEMFKFPEKIESATNLNDIIDRSEKHSDCYYFNTNDNIYEKLKFNIKSLSLIYKISNNGEDIRNYKI